MKFKNKVFTAIVIINFVITMLSANAVPANNGSAQYDQEGHELIEKCRKVAYRYILGDNEWAPNRAKELLPAVQSKYDQLHSLKETPYHDFAAELKMLNAIVNDDRQLVKTFMKQNDYDMDTHVGQDSNYELMGVKFSIEEALAVYKKMMELRGAAPLQGKLSSSYLSNGCAVAALMYAAGQKAEAKALAKQLLPLAQQKKIEEKPNLYAIIKDNEAILRGILNDDKNVVVFESTEKITCPSSLKYFDLQSYTDMDSVGRWLETAYGEVYLDKKLKMPERLPSAYRDVGLAQFIAGNYDESERAYRIALRLAKERYGEETRSFYPEIILQIKSEYAGMLKVAGKINESAKLAEGLTPEYLEKLTTEADAAYLKHGDALYHYSKRPIPCEWGSEIPF